MANSSSSLELASGTFVSDHPDAERREFVTLVDGGSSDDSFEASADGLGFADETASRRSSEPRPETAAIIQDLESRLQAQNAQWETRLQELGTRLAAERIERDHVLAQSAMRLALAVAERVIRRELDGDTQALERLIEACLVKISDARRVKLRVHPDEVESLRERHELLKGLSVSDIIADRRVSPGGCLIETETSCWDATVEGQLDQIHAAMERLLESS